MKGKSQVIGAALLVFISIMSGGLRVRSVSVLVWQEIEDLPKDFLKGSGRSFLQASNNKVSRIQWIGNVHNVGSMCLLLVPSAASAGPIAVLQEEEAEGLWAWDKWVGVEWM